MGADRNDQKNERVESCCSEAWDLLQSISCCFGGFDALVLVLTFVTLNEDVH